MPLHQLTNISFSRFVCESDHAAFEALLREAMTGASQGEVHLLHDATPLPALLSLNRIEMNDAPAAVVIVSELSAQKRDEHIVAADKLARSILDQAAEAIVVCDETGRIVRANPIAQTLAGRNPMLRRFELVFPLRRVGADADSTRFTSRPRGALQSVHRCPAIRGRRGERQIADRQIPSADRAGLWQFLSGCRMGRHDPMG